MGSLAHIILSFFLQRGDTIDIISMNPSGLWRGKSQGRVGHFKFINVELLPDRNTLRQQRRSASEKLKVTEQPAGPPQSVEDLLKRIGLEVRTYQQFLIIFYIDIFTRKVVLVVLSEMMFEFDFFFGADT